MTMMPYCVQHGAYLGECGLDAGHVVRPGAGGAEQQVAAVLAAAHEAVPLTRRLVDALVTIPGAQ